MMPLLETAQESLAQLTKIEAARDGVEEAKALEDLRGDLKTLALPIHQLADNARLLRKEGVSLAPMAEISVTMETVKNIATRFSEVSKSTTLKGQRWTSLTKKLEALATLVETEQSKDWRLFFENSLFGGANPNQRKSTLAPTPENKKALLRYTELFEKFNWYRSRIPETVGEFNTLKALSIELATVKFQEKVPEAVRKFFEATSTGAGLDLLTDEVIDWLRTHNLLSSYVVRAKIN
jgi:hypothetical protein